ncbi:MAG: C39 family peptidase [Planctomycetes bacterium]|nr:C39 family peptidase [Planctomycetota bacterium]
MYQTICAYLRNRWTNSACFVATSLGLGLSILLLTNASAAGPLAARSVLIRGVPHVEQKPDFCGEACAAMYLAKLGHRYDQDAVFDASGLDPLLARGCYTKELNTALIKIGFRTGNVWQNVAAADSARQLEAQWKTLHADLVAGIPSIVCMHYDEREGSSEHFRLILGYDAARDEVIFQEPALADGAYRRLPQKTFLALWPLKYDPRSWTVVRMRLEPGEIAAPPRTVQHSEAALAQHMMKLKKKLPEGFSVVIQRPFVVVGDDPQREVERRAKDTVRWSVDLLKQDYFQRDPQDIIDIWLFKDKRSYEQHTTKIFGDKPTTPYGYYSPAHKSLIMNISTGGGTLVHEIVHPFMATNFPACPSWFNEGLASLYEQTGSRDGHIIGRTNWRLPGLQRAIRGRGLGSFEQLCSTSTREFYEDPRGTNYAQARYLCYYLQEQGKLQEFYRRFSREAAEDPTGFETLKSVLGEKDMLSFQKRWEKNVLALEFN